AAEDDLAEHDVEKRNRSADRRERVVPRVDRAAGGIGGDRGEERRIADAEADFLSFHVPVRGGDAEALMHRIAALLGIGGDEGTGQEEDGHGPEDRPAVAELAGHRSERVAKAGAEAE